MSGFLAKRTALDLSPRAKVLGYITLIAWSIVVLFPLYWLAITSFKTPAQVSQGPFYIPGVDFQPTLDNWHHVLVTLGNDTTRAYYNTVVVATISTLLAMSIGAFAAYGLCRFRYRPRVGMIALGVGVVFGAFIASRLGVPPILAAVSGLAVLVLLAPVVARRSRRSLGNSDVAFWLISQRILAPVAIVIPIYVLFQNLRLLDTLPALIITYTAANLPIVIWLMRDYFLNIPADLEEAAAVDGASPYRIFRSVVIPVAKPGIVATGILVLVFAWNEYLIALFLTTANAQTMPVLVSAQNATRGPEWWYMSVLILIMIIPVIVLAVILERFISRGALTGAVKG